MGTFCLNCKHKDLVIKKVVVKSSFEATTWLLPKRLLIDILAVRLVVRSLPVLASPFYKFHLGVLSLLSLFLRLDRFVTTLC